MTVTRGPPDERPRVRAAPTAPSLRRAGSSRVARRRRFVSERTGSRLNALAGKVQADRMLTFLRREYPDALARRVRSYGRPASVGRAGSPTARRSNAPGATRLSGHSACAARTR
jgi:hypothetical protein